MGDRAWALVVALVIPASLPACYDPTSTEGDPMESTSESTGGPTTLSTSSSATGGPTTGVTSSMPDDGSATAEAESTSPTTTPSESASSEPSTGDGDASADGSSSTADGDDTTSTTTSGSSSDDGVVGCVADGVIADGEQCDDDNAIAGDGCSDCAFEPGFGCTGEPSLCGPSCDPLLQDCAIGQGCYALEPIFACAADASGESGVQGDDCDVANVCNPGLVCAAAGLLDDCDGGSFGCCTLLCDLSFPECPGTLTCDEYYELGSAPPGLENVGVCV